MLCINVGEQILIYVLSKLFSINKNTESGYIDDLIRVIATCNCPKTPTGVFC